MTRSYLAPPVRALHDGRMLLATLAHVSREVATTSARSRKISLLADLFRAAGPDDVPVVIPWLAGRLPQGRIGVGRQILKDPVAPAATATLTVRAADGAVTALAGVSGPGSVAERRRLVEALLGAATGEEQRFLIALLSGEVRQGALDAVAVEALARATGAPPAAVRRAVMLAGSLQRVAERLLAEGRWVFKKKADGRFRARLVAKGFTQIEGVDFDETFSPVARFESLRLVLALATLENWEIHQMDVKSAFLHGELEEEIYMEQPTGFVVAGKEHLVCKLQKALYGLKQASRAWNLQFHGVLTELGYSRTYSDAGVYVCHLQEGDDSIIDILYVDDITILGNSINKINALKSSLSSRYEMTDLGEIQSYLGVNITRDRANRTMEINQKEYIQMIVEKFGMRDANPVHTPLPAGCEGHLVKFEDQASASDIKKYQQLIGSLLYAQIGTRPDISFTVARLSQYSSNPSPHHARLAKYVLAYLNTTQDKALHFGGGKSGEGLHGFADSSWGDQEDRHSTSGFVFILANAAISWSSRKQKTIAQSTTEAEYMSVCEASNQAAWYKTFLQELGYKITSPIPLHCDNKGAVDLALNPVTGRRSKHIAIKYHAIREYVDTKVIDLVRTPTGEMLADGLTKSLSRAPFDLMVSGLGLA